MAPWLFTARGIRSWAPAPRAVIARQRYMGCAGGRAAAADASASPGSTTWTSRPCALSLIGGRCRRGEDYVLSRWHHRLARGTRDIDCRQKADTAGCLGPDVPEAVWHHGQDEHSLPGRHRSRFAARACLHLPRKDQD